jgi:general secretion pathway protein G
MGLNSKLIVKYLSIGIVTALSLCGIVFIILTLDMIAGGSDESHSRQKKARIELLRLDKSLAEYKLDSNNYPDSLLNLYKENHPRWMGPYIKEKELKDPWGEFYHYRNYPEREGYQLFTLGKDKKIGGDNHNYDQLSEGSMKIFDTTN